MPYVDTKPITYGTSAGEFINGGGIPNGGAASAGVKFSNAPSVGGLDSVGAVRLYGLAGNDTLYGTAHSDTLVGGDGTDLLRGGAACDQLYGNGGSDQFFFKLGDLGTTYASGTAVTAAMWNPATGGDMIMDFQGAGGYFSGNNDFVSFNGFGTVAQGAYVEYLGTVTNFASAAVYAVHAAPVKGGGINLFTVQLDGGASTHLVSGDYQFNA